ncbi:MAG: UDP-N-acetylmuramoyl-L-alanine--D-glutamate ligase [Chitinophagaceae bacterium]|nr:UDP-N-acetylmuramoyl-L-alanine--D-glutamate ligase [Chitinophagaceae bacterium]
MQRIVILGAAESGVGAAVLAKLRGFDVFVSDSGLIKEEFKSVLQQYEISFEEKFHTGEKIFSANEIIKSPGIPEKAPLIQQLRSKGISIISEIEFASRYTKSTIIAITGTNGKSTTTSLIHHILDKAGFDVSLVGNIGKSFAKQVAEHDTAYYVAEISSFQLDDCYAFKPHIAVLTNLSDNHLDRYHYQFNEYADAKFRIAIKQTAADYFIYCEDDVETVKALNRHSIASKKISFSQEKKLAHGAWIENNEIIFHLNNTTFSMSLFNLGLRGKHNVYNSMAAGIVGSMLDIRKETTREALSDFSALEHRLEWVADVHGIEFINDSKATSVNAVWYAMESIHKPIVWIAGGVDKGNDYSLLIDLVRSKVKAIVCMGLDNRKIHEAFSRSVDMIVNTESMADAVKTAYRLSTNGDCVLLSPACASFDLFQNFEDRGLQFKEKVRSL